MKSRLLFGEKDNVEGQTVKSVNHTSSITLIERLKAEHESWKESLMIRQEAYKITCQLVKSAEKELRNCKWGKGQAYKNLREAKRKVKNSQQAISRIPREIRKRTLKNPIGALEKLNELMEIKQ